MLRRINEANLSNFDNSAGYQVSRFEIYEQQQQVEHAKYLAIPLLHRKLPKFGPYWKYGNDEAAYGKRRKPFGQNVLI